MSHMPTLDLVENNRPGGSMGIGNYKGVMLCNRPFNTMAGVCLRGLLSAVSAVSYDTEVTMVW